MNGTTMSPRAWAELLLLAGIWGASFFSIAIAQREIGPVTVVLHQRWRMQATMASFFGRPA